MLHEQDARPIGTIFVDFAKDFSRFGVAILVFNGEARIGRVYNDQARLPLLACGFEYFLPPEAECKVLDTQVAVQLSHIGALQADAELSYILTAVREAVLTVEVEHAVLSNRPAEERSSSRHAKGQVIRQGRLADTLQSDQHGEGITRNEMLNDPFRRSGFNAEQCWEVHRGHARNLARPLDRDKGECIRYHL